MLFGWFKQRSGTHKGSVGSNIKSAQWRYCSESHRVTHFKHFVASCIKYRHPTEWEDLKKEKPFSSDMTCWALDIRLLGPFREVWDPTVLFHRNLLGGAAAGPRGIKSYRISTDCADGRTETRTTSRTRQEARRRVWRGLLGERLPQTELREVPPLTFVWLLLSAGWALL